MLPENINCALINTGNLINSKELKKKAMQTPAEEVLDSAVSTFHSWMMSTSCEKESDSNCIFCTSPQAMKVSREDRIQLKVSIKVFLNNYDCEDLKSSVEQVLKNLDIDVVDSFVLALPSAAEGSKFNLELVKPLWSELETFVTQGKLVAIGVSDLDTSELAELYEWTKVKPSVNQVNLESCCVMPPEMIAFAKDNDIQLLTHNDPKVLLSQKSLQEMLENQVHSPESWGMRWIARYSIIIKSRGIVQNKGYLLYLAKER